VKSSKVSIDLRVACAALAALLVVTIVLWKPWSSSSNTDRTIDSIGEATVTSEADEFVFYPSYRKRGNDIAAIQKELQDTVNVVIAKLKELGVPEKDIILQSNSYDNYWVENGQQTTANSLTIKVPSKEQAQKVQDYLLTTAPEGQVSPQPSFSEQKLKSLEQEARIKAIEDARQKATRTAEELGKKVGDVVRITDGSSAPYAPVGRSATTGIALSSESASMPVLTGEQEVYTTITVVYELK
jgi:uncharacterized protein